MDSEGSRRYTFPDITNEPDTELQTSSKWLDSLSNAKAIRPWKYPSCKYLHSRICGQVWCLIQLFKDNIWKNDLQCNQQCRALMKPSDSVLILVVKSYYEKHKAQRLAFCTSKDKMESSCNLLWGKNTHLM